MSVIASPDCIRHVSCSWVICVQPCLGYCHTPNLGAPYPYQVCVLLPLTKCPVPKLAPVNRSVGQQTGHTAVPNRHVIMYVI